MTRYLHIFGFQPQLYTGLDGRPVFHAGSDALLKIRDALIIIKLMEYDMQIHKFAYYR